MDDWLASLRRLHTSHEVRGRAVRAWRRGLALFLTWVLVFQAIYGANTTEAIAEGLQDLGEQIAQAQTPSGDGGGADTDAAGEAAADTSERAQTADWSSHTDALVLSSTGLALDYAGTDVSGATAAGSADAVVLPECLSANLNLTVDLDVTRDADASLSGSPLLAGDTFSVPLPEGVSLASDDAVPVYALDDAGNATTEQVAELTTADGDARVTLLEAAAGRTSLACSAGLPVLLDSSLVEDVASSIVWTLQSSSNGVVRTAELEVPSRRDVALGLGLLAESEDAASEPAAQASQDSQAADAPSVTIAPSDDRSASASSFVTAWADNNSPERPRAEELASRREYRLYFQVEGDDTRYPLTTDGRTVSADAQRLLGLTQDELDDIRLSASAPYGSEPELVSVEATGTNEYTATSAAGLPSGVVTTTVAPGTDEDGNPISTTTTETRKVTWCITHEVAGDSSESVAEGALLYDTEDGEPSYLSMSSGKLDSDVAPFEREVLAAVARRSVNVVLNLGMGSESYGNLYDWLDVSLSDGTLVRDHVHLGAWVGDEFYKGFTGGELDETMELLRATLVESSDSDANSYVLSLYAPLYDQDRNSIDLRLWQDEIENSNVDGYRDYYQVWYDNAGSITAGSDASASFGSGSMTVTRTGNTSFSATKVWLDDDPSSRPATTYTLWRYSDKQGQSSLTATQVQFDNGTFASATMSAEQNAALGSVELGGADGNTPQNNVSVDIVELLRAQSGDAKLPKYDQDGYPYVYFVREEIEGSGYSQVMGTVDADGNVEEGSDPGPNYWNGSRTEQQGAQNSKTERPVGDAPVYDGGTITNVRSEVEPQTITKTWDAAAYQDQLSDVVVTMKCQRILKRHAHETSPGVWVPNYDPMYDENGDWAGTYEWSDFEAAPGETSPVQELTGWNAENESQTLTGNYDKYDEHGEEYVYRWVEVNVAKGDEDGFYMPSDDYMDGLFFLTLTDEDGEPDSVTFASHNDPATGTVTNRYVNTTERHVDKLWAQVDADGNLVTDEDGNTQWSQDAKPYGDGRDVGSVSVRLVRDGELVGEFEMDGVADDEPTELKNPDGSAMMGDELDFWSFGVYSSPSTVQETSPWHLDFSNLPKFAADGHKYSYQVIETGKAGFLSSHDYDADALTTTIRNTPGEGSESSTIRVSKRWLDGGNNTARPNVRVGIYARHDMANAAGTVHYAAGDKVGEVSLDATNEWYDELTVPIGGLTEDDFTASELSTEADGASLDSAVATGETRVVTKAESQALADAGDSSYEALLASWDGAADDGQRILTTDYAYEVSYGHNDALDSLEVTNRRVGLAHIDIYKSWSDVGADEEERPHADFCISNAEGKVTFSYDENGDLLASVDGMDPLPVRGEGTVSTRDVDSSYSVSRLNRDNTEISDDGLTLRVHVNRLGGSHDAYTIQGLPKYDASGEVLRWGVTESWDGDAGDYVSARTGYSEQFGGEASPWHHLDLMEYSFTNTRSATKDVTFHTRWYDHYVRDTLDQRVDVYLTIYQRVRVYDADGNPTFDADGNPVYTVEPVEGYQHYNWEGEGETGEDALYNQFATVSGLAKYDEHGGEIVYYASVHHSQSDSTYSNLDYADPWFTYGENADDPENNGYPGNSAWDEANADDDFKAGSPDKVQVDATASGDLGFAVREDGTFNLGLSASITIPGEKLWANLPTGFSREDLPSIEFYLQRRVAGGHYEVDGSWASGGNGWGELSVSAGAAKGDYSVLSYDSSGEADYGVADGTTAVAWTGNLTQVRGNRYSFTMSRFGDNDDDASTERQLPKYDRNGRPYEYRVREIIDGLIQREEDGSDVPGGFDASDLESVETPEEGASGVYTVRYGSTESYRVSNIVNESAKGRLTVKKLFYGLEPGDLLPDCTFALYRYYVRPNGEASQAQLVETKSMSFDGERANDQGRLMRVMTFDDLDVYTPAGTYWVYFVAEQPINGYRTSVGTGDLAYGSSELKSLWTGADMLADGSVRTDDSATVPPVSEGSALYKQPTNSLVANDYTVDFTFQNSYYGETHDLGELSGKKYWYDQHDAAGTRPEDIELSVTRRYASGELDATDDGVVTLQSNDPDAANYISWNKAAGADGSADVWTYTISNLERIAPDGTYWRYEVRERAADGSDYLVSSSANGGTVDMEGYVGDALSVGRIDNHLKTRVGYSKKWVGDASDAWRQRPIVYVTLQARTRAEGGDWGSWAEAGSVFEKTFGLSLEQKAHFSEATCPVGSVLPSGQNTVERLSTDGTGNFTKQTVWKDLPATYEANGTTYELDYRVVESRLVYDKKGEKHVVDVASPGSDGTYDSVNGAYQPSQTESSKTSAGSGESYKHSTITNTLVDATSLTVAKTWDDDGNAWASRPGTSAVSDGWSVTYVLQRRVGDGSWAWLTSYGEEVENPFDASGELDARLRRVTVSDTGDSVTATFASLPLYAPDGDTYEYRAVELVRGSYEVPGGEVLATSAETSLVVANGDGASCAYENSLRRVSLSGTKTWNDWGSGMAAGLTPEDSGIHLALQRSVDGGTTWTAATHADGSEETPSWDVDTSGTWTYTFDGLPETDQQGRAYSYRAVETDGSVPGFFSDKSSSVVGTAADGSIENVATRLTFDKVGDGTTGSAASLNGVRFVVSRDGREVATWERAEGGTVTSTVGGAKQTGAAAGYIVGLPAGTYTVHEDVTPAGYVAAADFTLTIGADGSVSTSAGSVVASDGAATVTPARGNACVRVSNSVFRAQVSLEKFFSHGTDGMSVAVPGMTFDLYRTDADGTDILVASGITTDAQGRWSSATSDIAVERDASGSSVLGAFYERLSDGLPQGNYYLLETGTSPLTHGSGSRYDFSVTADDHAKTVAVRAENEEFSAFAHLAKVDAETSTAIDGATFELLYTPEGTDEERSLGALQSGRSYALDATCTGIESSATSDAGRLLVSGLKKGTYRLVEVANEGYALPSDKPQVRWTVADDDQGADIDLADDEHPWTDALTENDALVNYPLHGSVTFRKLGEDGSGLNGASFKLQVKQGDEWADVASGTVLESGRAYEADVVSGAVASLADTGAAEDGRITIANLPWGTYRLVEVESAPGYVGKTSDGWPTSAEVTIDRASVAASAAAPLDMGTVTNRKATIAIRKTSWESGTPLAGAHFTVRLATGEPFLDGAIEKRLTTDASGIARADEPSAASDGNSNELAGAVEPGQSYVITETQAPAGYGTPDPASYTVRVAEDGTLVAEDGDVEAWDIDTMDDVSTVIVRDKAINLQFKKVDENGDPLVGSEFTLSGTFTDGEGTRVVSPSGDAAVALSPDDMLEGEVYTLHETQPPVGYATVADLSFRVANAENGEVRIEPVGELPAGWSISEDGVTVTAADEPVEFLIQKRAADTGEPLANGTFNISGLFVDDEGNVTRDTYTGTTGAAGTILSVDCIAAGARVEVLGDDGSKTSEVADGIYEVSETSAPYGYELAGSTLRVRISADGSVSVVGEAPDGWSLDEGTATVTLSDERIRLGFSKVANGTDASLEGAEFSISGVFAAEDGTLQNGGHTQELSGLTIDDLCELRFVAGEGYRLTETKAPAGYEVISGYVEFDVTDSGTFTRFRSNASNGSYGLSANRLTITARDLPIELTITKSSEDGRRLAGASFSVAPAAGSTFADGSTEALELVTDVSGVARLAGAASGASLSALLVAGNTYVLAETKAPAGHKLIFGEVRVTVASDGTVTIDGQDAVANGSVALKGSDAISVTDEAVPFSIVKYGEQAADGTRPTLEGARFSVTPKDGSAFADGTTSAREVTTGEDGRAGSELSGMLVVGGTYGIREVEAPAGYTRIDHELVVRVADDGTLVAVFGGQDEAAALRGYEVSGGELRTFTGSVTDEATSLTVMKRDATNPLVGLDDATFSLAPVDGFTFADGSTEAREVTTADTGVVSGVASFDRALLRADATSVYELRETRAPDGYALAGTSVLLRVDFDGSVTPVRREGSDYVELDRDALRALGFDMTDDVATVLATDAPVNVTIRKTSEDGTPLAGATFTLTPAEGTNDYGEPNRFASGSETDVLELTSTTQGILLSRQLVAGNTYELEETAAPEGYAVGGGRVLLHVNEDGTLAVSPVDEGMLAGDDVAAIEPACAYVVGEDGVSVTLADPPTRLTIAKAGSDGASGAAMAGARFEVRGRFAGSAEETALTLATGANGLTEQLTGRLVAGERYVVREVAAPAGYQLLGGEFELWVRQDGTIVSGGDVPGWSLATDAGGAATLTATDDPVPPEPTSPDGPTSSHKAMPQTGDDAGLTLMASIAVAGLALLALGLRRRRHNA